MKKIILIITLAFIISCENERLHQNTYAVRKATSEKELVNTFGKVIPGRVVSLQLEYKNQNLSLSASSTEDSGIIGIDEINILIPEDYEFNYRLDNGGYNITVKLFNETNVEIFHLYSENTEYKGLLLAGEYKLVIENHIEWRDMDSSIIPVFLQPDYQYLEDFGSTVINNSYHERDIYQLISVKKCEYCDLANGDSTVFGGQFYSEVSFRGSNLSNSNFTRSYFENSIFSSYIDNEIPIYSYGHTNLNNAIFEYCKMNWVNFSETYDMNDTKFFFSDINYSNFTNSRGKNLDFESTLIGSATFAKSNYLTASFIGANATGSNFEYAKILDSDLSSGIFTNSNFYNASINASILNYALFDSVYAHGVDFCRITRIGADFSNLIVDSTTLCNPLELEEIDE